MAPMGMGGRIIGTPAYTAPEFVNMQSPDARADLYSLGATLYYGLTRLVSSKPTGCQ
jgi:serine/threonine protein kinase